MKLEAIHAREIAMRLIAPFETSFGVTHDRRILLIELVTSDGSGWGEVTAPEAPFYNSETVDTAWIVLRKFLAPLVLGQEMADPTALAGLMAPVRGHEMAKGALECAAWHAASVQAGVPLAQLLGGTLPAIECGVSLGIHRDVPALLDRIERELRAGYRRIKLKIKPGADVRVAAAVRERFPFIHLTVDANSAYTLDDLPLLQRLDEFSLDYIEQPLAWNEIYQHAALQKQLRTALCLDECIHSLRDTEAALALGACRVINIKLGRVSGHSEARRIQQHCRERNVPVWCGGMLESGIGRAHNIAMSALPGFALPGDVSASQRYWARDIVTPEVTVNPDGTITVPTTPGLGFDIDRDYVSHLTVRSESWTARSGG
ncbi:MAG: o-succinylbenzoate synthase [Acidobacteriaceae bacterium]